MFWNCFLFLISMSQILMSRKVYARILKTPPRQPNQKHTPRTSEKSQPGSILFNNLRPRESFRSVSTCRDRFKPSVSDENETVSSLSFVLCGWNKQQCHLSVACKAWFIPFLYFRSRKQIVRAILRKMQFIFMPTHIIWAIWDEINRTHWWALILFP